MHSLRLHTPDIHGLLGRLPDRIRLADLPIASIEAHAHGEGHVVEAQIATNDRHTIERLAHQMRQVIGTTVVEIDCACAPSAGARYFHLQAISTAG
jgi:hypothetical protein